MSLFLSFVLLGILFLLAAFFSATETALFSLSKIEKHRVQERHPKWSKWIFYHLEHPRRTLITILLGNLIVNTVATSLVTLTTLRFLHPEYLSLVLVAFTVFLIIATEITPKTLAVQQNELISLLTAFPLQVFAVILAPFRFFVRKVSDIFLKIIVPERKEKADHMSEEELKTLMRIGEEEGVLDRKERRMIQKLLELGERPVKEIMTPRTRMAALDADEPREKHIEIIKSYHFSRFPIYQGSIDNILGLVLVQEYMLKPVPLNELLIQPLFVPEQKHIAELFAEFRAKNRGFAVCVDEYGGTAGIVTLEDIFEEIFGEYYDEYEKVENPIRALGHGEFLVEAKIPLAQFNEHFSTQFEAEDAATLAGFILEKMGEVPEKGKVLQLPEGEIRIHDVIRHRLIKSVIVRFPK